jgi:hypothetical protein
MGQPRFELGSMAPKATRIDLATLLPRSRYIPWATVIKSYLKTRDALDRVRELALFFSIHFLAALSFIPSAQQTAKP